MNPVFAIFLALLPVFVLAAIIMWFDRYNPEPKDQIRKAIFLGAASCFVSTVFCVFTESIEFHYGIDWSKAGPVAQALHTALFMAAMPEEAAKLLLLWLFIRKNRNFDEHVDGIVYAACVALGFAGFENLLYVFRSGDAYVATAVARAITAVPGHYAFGILMGFFVGLAFFEKNPNRRFTYWAMAYLTPVALHFVYDALLMVQETGIAFGGVLSVIFFVFVIKMHKLAISKIKTHLQNDGVRRA